MITENLSTLKIHKLTKKQYESERDAGRLDPNAIYLTPDETDGSVNIGGGVSSWKDIPDKPFYVVETNGTILLDGEFTTEYIGAYGVFGIDTAYNETIETAPEKVTLIYDGIEYKDITFTDIPDLGKVGGNLFHMNALFGTSFENTGEPFILAVTQRGCGIMTLDTAETAHAVKLFIAGESVEKINVSCLPDGYPYVGTAMAVPTFDGNMTGREAVMVPNVGYTVKVSSEYISVSDMIGSTLVYDMNGTEYTMTLTEENVVDAIDALGVPGTVILIDGMAAASFPEETSAMDVTLSAGTWFGCMPGQFYVKSISCLAPIETEVAYKMDGKYLPDGVPYAEIGMAPIVFDGDMTGREVVNMGGSALDGYVSLVKMSTEYIPASDMIGGVVTFYIWTGEQSVLLSEENVFNGADVLGVEGSAIIMDNLPLVYSVPAETTMEGLTLTTGTWFICAEDMLYTKTLSCLIGEVEVVHELDMKYLPANVFTQEKYDELRTHWTDEDGTVHQLDKKYIPSEWLAAEVPTDIIFMPTTSVTVESRSVRITEYLQYPITTLKSGTSAIVIFDGQSYALSACSHGSVVYLGNGSLAGLNASDTGEPFCIRKYNTDLRLYTNDTETTEHTIYIKLNGVILPIPVPEKYLPKSVALKSDLENIEIAASKMDSTNPVGTGSFSMNREENTTIGEYSHAEGYRAEASGAYSHAEGWQTTASGKYSHAEGCQTTASGECSHAEGSGTKAGGYYSHAEGYWSKTTIEYAHAEGYQTTASGRFSHAEGLTTEASGEASHVQGKYNIKDTENKYAHIVGNGEFQSPSNAHTLDWKGNAWYQGDVYVGSTSGTNKDDGSKKLATEEYIDIRVPAWTDADEGKFLRIVNGTPTWVSIPSAEEASF